MNEFPQLDISIIVTTFNQSDSLSLILKALDYQTYINFEVIIADDGSTDNTQKIIKLFSKTVNYKIEHVWQDNHGFRASEIRNKAVIKSRGEYLIFLDGDCIPQSNFIENHIRLSETGWYVRGNRIMLSEKLSNSILENKQNIFLWKKCKWMSLWLRGDIKRFFPIINYLNYPFRKIKSTKWYGVKTCNLAIWRKDYIAVNGLDESFQGWGREDSDLAVRLINSGIKRKEGIFATGVFHLWHKKADMARLDHNDVLLEQAIHQNRKRAIRGLDARKAY